VKLFLTPDLFLGDKILPAVHDEEKIRVLFNPAPTFPPAEANVLRGNDILYVGRIVPEKGIEMVLECAKRLPHRIFRVIGSGEFEVEAKALAQQMGIRNVQWLGPVYNGDLVRHFQECGALILPSRWYDNMPLVLTQALILGIPIVASRINGIPEFVIEGKTGRLAEPLDPEDFTRKLQSVFADLSMTEALSTEGKVRAKAWFSPEFFGPNLELILEETALIHV
jgi:glycosyltransferase involved in cell wall biosynthesis